MVSRRPVVLVLAWVLSLVGAGVAGAALTQRGDEPRVISGSDFGFLVERIGRNDAPIGRLVVRVDGKWVDPEIAPAMRMAK
jgi:hypothetical protein